MKLEIDEAMPDEQAGFRKDATASGHLTTVQMLLDSAADYGEGLKMALCEVGKEFGKKKCGAIGTAMMELGVASITVPSSRLAKPVLWLPSHSEDESTPCHRNLNIPAMTLPGNHDQTSHWT